MHQTIGRICVALLCCLSLTGCFISNTPLIAENQGILPIDGDTWIGADAYSRAAPEGDGYRVAGADAPPEPVRFSPLTVLNGKQYFVTEVPTGEGTGSWFYGIARRTVSDRVDGPVIQLALLDCAQLPGQIHADMRADGWQLTDDDSVICAPPDLEALKTLYRDNLTAEMLESDEWWDDQNN